MIKDSNIKNIFACPIGFLCKSIFLRIAEHILI